MRLGDVPSTATQTGSYSWMTSPWVNLRGGPFERLRSFVRSGGRELKHARHNGSVTRLAGVSTCARVVVVV